MSGSRATALRRGQVTQPPGLRVLVTGSRLHDFDNPPSRDLIYGALVEALRQAGPDGATLVHGDAPGADTTARILWMHHLREIGDGSDPAPVWWPKLSHEPHPALWGKHGKAAGPIRNQEMVDIGANVCLAFPWGESRGTRDCMRRAKAAGISVAVYELATAPSGDTP